MNLVFQIPSKRKKAVEQYRKDGKIVLTVYPRLEEAEKTRYKMSISYGNYDQARAFRNLPFTLALDQNEEGKVRGVYLTFGNSSAISAIAKYTFKMNGSGAFFSKTLWSFLHEHFGITDAGQAVDFELTQITEGVPSDNLTYFKLSMLETPQAEPMKVDDIQKMVNNSSEIPEDAKQVVDLTEDTEDAVVNTMVDLDGESDPLGLI